MENPKEVVFNYIALGVISELDEVYYASVRSPLKEQLEEMNFELPIENFDKVNVKKDLDFFNRFLLSIVIYIQILYEILYFHFMPYLLFIMIIIASRSFNDYTPFIR